MRRLGWFAAGPLLMALLAVDCGDVDAGSARFVGEIRYEDAAGGYALRLLVPPWVAVHVLGVTAFLVPPSNTTVPSDLTHAIATALYSLEVQRPAGEPMAAMEQVFAALPTTGTVGPRAFTTAAGARGLELAWREAEGVFHRDAFVPDSTTQTFQLHFSGQHPLEDDPMLAQMISSFQPTQMVASAGR